MSVITIIAALVASLLDPINGAISFLVGWTILSWRTKLIVAFVVGISMVAMVSYLNARAPSAFQFGTLAASIIWASIAGAFRARREKGKAKAIAAEAAAEG